MGRQDGRKDDIKEDMKEGSEGREGREEKGENEGRKEGKEIKGQARKGKEENMEGRGGRIQISLFPEAVSICFWKGRRIFIFFRKLISSRGWTRGRER